MAQDGDIQLYKAHERIRALTKELAMQEDAAVRIAALRKKIAECKEKAQTIASVANKRIAYLSGMWKDTSDVMKSDFSDAGASRIGAAEQISRGEKTYNDVFSSAASALEAISTAKLQDELKKECARLAKELRTFMCKLEEGAKYVERKAKSIPKSGATTDTASSDAVNSTKRTSGKADIPSKPPDIPKIAPLLKGDRAPALVTTQHSSPTKIQKTQESLKLPSAQAQKELHIENTPPTAISPMIKGRKLKNSNSSSTSGSKERVHS